MKEEWTGERGEAMLSRGYSRKVNRNKKNTKETSTFSMDDCFSIEYVRKELINKLKEKGLTDEEIERLISMCDEMYNEHKIPYPTAEEILELENGIN